MARRRLDPGHNVRVVDAAAATASVEPVLTAALLSLRPGLRGVQYCLPGAVLQCLDRRTALKRGGALHEKSVSRPRTHDGEPCQHRLETSAPSSIEH